MNEKASTFLTVLTSVAIAVPLALMVRGAPAVVGGEALTAVVDRERLVQLEQRIDALAEREQNIRVPIEADVGPVAEKPAMAGPDRALGLARIQSLEQRVAALERAGRAARRGQDLRRFGAEAAAIAALQKGQLRKAREDAKRRILDPRASDEEKVQAHRVLRQAPNAYTPAMVRELVRIGTSHKDAQTRACVWCFFDGQSHIPALVPTLLRALAYDQADVVRDEASETLGNYITDPAVLHAVRYAAEHDTSARVRRKASRTLRQHNLAVVKRK